MSKNIAGSASRIKEQTHKLLQTLNRQLDIFRLNQEILQKKIEEDPNTIANRYYRTLRTINDNVAITTAINAFLRDNPPKVINALQDLLEDECDDEFEVVSDNL